MSKGSGEINVTTEVAYCNFCGRPRTLRREERHLGDLIRTMVTCESCHRTLTTSIGAAVTPTPAAPDAPEANAEPTTTPAVEPPAAPAPSPQPAGAKATTPVAKPKAPARRDAKR